MKHSVFGKIEWDDLGRWAGRVQLDFFAGYDTVAAALSAERQGVADWLRPRDNRYQQGDFELCLINFERGEPSSSQEKAFLHFLKTRDTICNAVVSVIFDYYQTNWGFWRGEYGDALLIPELQSRDDLKRVIRFGTLYVLDDPAKGAAVIGYCFDCSWDAEHGLGVLVRGGRVIELGENDITWNGPRGAGLPVSPGSDLTNQIREQKAIATIKNLGGSVTASFNATEPGKPVIRIDLRDKQISDADLKSLRHCQNLRELVIAGTPVTAAGLKELRELKNLDKLDISGTPITDAGLKEFRELENLKSLHLSGTSVTDAGLKELGERKSLVVLHLGDTKVTDVGVKELRRLTGLQHLELSGTRVTDAGLQELKELWGLVSLDLQGTPVTDAGLKGLKDFKSLRHLNLAHSKVTDAGLEQLKELKSLRALKLQSTAATDAGVADLQRALPKLQVIR
jgi:Leucine-rich repeat (LRR) protein